MDVATAMGTSDWDPFQKMGRASASKSICWILKVCVCVQERLINCVLIRFYQTVLNNSQFPPGVGG